MNFGILTCFGITYTYKLRHSTWEVTLKCPYTIILITVFPARAHVAGRDSTSRSSVASKAISQSSSESQYSKPNTAATQKSTGLTISVHISPRPGDLGKGISGTQGDCDTALYYLVLEVSYCRCRDTGSLQCIYVHGFTVFFGGVCQGIPLPPPWLWLMWYMMCTLCIRVVFLWELHDTIYTLYSVQYSYVSYNHDIITLIVVEG